ncbi:TPA: hypothetical protein ACPVXA_004625 [Vibrio parahaemolyticus]|nr:hypothetical protein [Vibrio parahaemolyticus]HCH2083782.1 hypothetical protein [Vibrio parahaemolyticus]
MAKTPKNKCSLKVVTDEGKRLHGTAAILHHTSKNGGYDAWLEEYTETQMKKAAKDAVRSYIEDQAKPNLTVVNGGDE